MIAGISYKGVAAARQEKPPYISGEETWTLPNREPDTEHEPRGREVELMYVNTNCRYTTYHLQSN